MNETELARLCAAAGEAVPGDVQTRLVDAVDAGNVADLTLGGYPRHPLYQRSASDLFAWREPRRA